ncbi:MAG TPA: carbohydrate ABC transporter permease [Fusicatenibacter saccharivorans]|jgi:putative aldouronate transport system permease protein|nr:carbohydrate ABC transporter permease [Fusicatenibacter saccharivorans]
MRGFLNSLIITFCGVMVNLIVTLPTSYALSRSNFSGKKPITIFYLITMFFGGGLIPTYLVIQRLQMLNTIWALILPGCLSVYNMIVARTFFKSNISEELYEAAEIDGCTQARFFFQIALPLSKAIIAILVLYYGVGHWNSYFSALVYISDKAKYPLQLVLRNILITNQTALSQTATTAAARAALQEKQQLIDVMKYSLIIISSIPVLVMYPLVQKHFVKGVMIGSMKG